MKRGYKSVSVVLFGLKLNNGRRQSEENPGKRRKKRKIIIKGKKIYGMYNYMTLSSFRICSI